MTLLRCETKQGGRGSAGSIRVYTDAVLFHRPADAYGNTGYSTPRWRMPVSIHAMSIVGPEQSVRAIAAGCALEHEYERTTLDFVGTSERVSGRWTGPWNCEARMLTQGVMHMVAMPRVSITKTVGQDVAEHVIVPDAPDKSDLPRSYYVDRAIYERLLVAYTTPLLPIDLPGQSADEIEASYEWMKVLTAALKAEKRCWLPLESHPDQTDRSWHGAGLLKLKEAALDLIVGELVADRSLIIPPAVKEAA